MMIYCKTIIAALLVAQSLGTAVSSARRLRKPTGRILAEECVDPKAKLEEACPGGYDLYWAKTSSSTAWESWPGYGHCIYQNDGDLPSGFSSDMSITKVDGDEYLQTISGFDNTLYSQKFEFKDDSQCFLIDGAHKSSGNCFDAIHSQESCQELEFFAQSVASGQHEGKIQAISHNELIFGCCSGAGAGPGEPENGQGAGGGDSDVETDEQEQTEEGCNQTKKEFVINVGSRGKLRKSLQQPQSQRVALKGYDVDFSGLVGPGAGSMLFEPYANTKYFNKARVDASGNGLRYTFEDDAFQHSCYEYDVLVGFVEFDETFCTNSTDGNTTMKKRVFDVEVTAGGPTTAIKALDVVNETGGCNIAYMSVVEIAPKGGVIEVDVTTKEEYNSDGAPMISFIKIQPNAGRRRLNADCNKKVAEKEA